MTAGMIKKKQELVLRVENFYNINKILELQYHMLIGPVALRVCPVFEFSNKRFRGKFQLEWSLPCMCRVLLARLCILIHA